jgi:hypothetical protein
MYRQSAIVLIDGADIFTAEFAEDAEAVNEQDSIRPAISLSELCVLCGEIPPILHL